VCPESAVSQDGSVPQCTTDFAGQNIVRATRIYCTIKSVNNGGATLAIAFVFDSKEFFQQTTGDGGAFFANYTYPETFPPGSWGCRAKINGTVVRELTFTTSR